MNFWLCIDGIKEALPVIINGDLSAVFTMTHAWANLLVAIDANGNHSLVPLTQIDTSTQYISSSGFALITPVQSNPLNASNRVFMFKLIAR